MALAMALLVAFQVQSSQPSPFRAQIVAAVRVHGNVLTPDAEVLRIAAITVGEPFGSTTIGEATTRLRASHRFERVEVLKRFASIDDPSQILIMIVVDEGPVRVQTTGDPDQPVRVVRSRRPFMVMPILNVEDGYGLSYGARLTVPQIAGDRARVSFPLTWGGQKLAAGELSRRFDQGWLSYLEGGVSFSQRNNPFYEVNDDRWRAWTHAEKRLTSLLTVGGSGEWQHASFASLHDQFLQLSTDLVFDTRRDPVLPRNAVYARAAVSHLMLPEGAVNRHSLRSQLYLGVHGQAVLVASVQHEGSDSPLPPYLQPLLGGMSNLRGFRAGTSSGDNLLATSLELRVPLTSPLSFGKLGISGFMDAAGVYGAADRITDVRMMKGVGASLWFSATFLRASLAVAHGVGGSTQLHFGTSVTF